MTRMTREFSLVLLGAGALTAGYFAWPEKDFEKRSEEEAQRRVGGTHRTHGGMLIWVHGGRGAVYGRGAATGGTVSRGGFGATGARIGGGGG